MNKIRTIAWKELYTTFRDRNLLLIMFATPLAISTIVGVAFGGLGDDAGGFADIPVAVVNFDEGTEQVNYGRNFADALTGRSEAGDGGGGFDCALDEQSGEANDNPSIALDELIAASILQDVDEARAAVDNGDYVAAVIIPSSFSADLSPDFTTGSFDIADITPIEVYANEGQPISVSIVRAVVEGFVNPIKTGNIAISSSVQQIVSNNPLAAVGLNSEEAQGIFPCAYSDTLGTVSINQLTLSVETDDNDLSVIANILIQVGAAQAVFFAMFSGQAGIISIVEERRQGTLQRLIVSPTSRTEILAGKVSGTFFIVLFQVSVLLIALTLVASLLDGEPTFIWGTNIIGIVVIVLGIALAVCGLGVLVAGIAKTPEQVNGFGTLLNILLAVAGGAFGFALPSPIRDVSLIYWGTDGLYSLAQGQTDVLLNIAVLFGMGIVFFGIGLTIFNRRQEI